MSELVRPLLAFLAAFGAVALLCPGVIRLMKRLNFTQSIRSDGPRSHLIKEGTPIMGGVLIVFGTVLSALLLVKGGYSFVLPALLYTVCCGLMGFLDDFIKVRQHRTLGLLAYQKVLIQFFLSLGAALWLYHMPEVGSAVRLPFTDKVWDLGVFYVPFAMFVLMGSVNAVNLTDGLDGLAAGTSLVTEIAMGALFILLAAGGSLASWNASLEGYRGMAVFCFGAAGSCLGFLLYNIHPARIFMGDTGALALGGALAMSALLSKWVLLLPLIGVCYVATALSVILQVASYKLRHGKRIFLMAPLHHHFELKGYGEHRIVLWYDFVTLTASAAGLLLAVL